MTGVFLKASRPVAKASGLVLSFGDVVLTGRPYKGGWDLFRLDLDFKKGANFVLFLHMPP